MITRSVPSRFAVAFSLAGEQRSLVQPIAMEVEAVLGRSSVFYDGWYEHWLAGTDADLVLGGLYGQSAELVVFCVSAAYGEKPWTRTEHRAVRARLMGAGEDRLSVLPIRVGEGDVDGVLFNEIVPDVRGRTPAEAAALIVARLDLVRGAPAGGGSPPLEVAASDWPPSPPELQWPMADHTDARAAFAALVSAGSPHRALLVHGASETGKSHMSKQMARNAMALPGVRCARFDLKGTTSMDVEVEAFTGLLGVDVPPAGALTARLSHIFAALRTRARPTVLIFDSYESAGEARDWVEKVLLPSAHHAAWLRVVVVGQSVPSRFGTTWESLAAPTLALQLPAIEHWLAYGLANAVPGVDLEFVTKAHQMVEGRATVLASLLGPRM